MNFTYSVPISPPKQGESSIYRSPTTAKTNLYTTVEDCKNLKQFLLSSKQKYGKLKYLGTKQPNAPYSWQSYEEIFELGAAFGSGLLIKNLVPSIKEHDVEFRFVGVYSRNRAEYMVADYAGILYGLTQIPIYDTLGPQALDYILDQTKMEIIICSKDNVQKLVAHGSFGSIKTIVSFDEITDDKILNQLKSLNLNFYSYQQIIDFGKKQTIPFAETSEKSIYIISYTSGTTGNPKGAMMTHGNFLSVMAIGKQNFQWKEGEIYLSFLPMAHVFERLVVLILTYFGCAIGYFGGDPSKLKDDFQALKPQIVAVVPRVFNRFHDLFKMNIEGLKGLKKWLVTKGINRKLDNLRKSNRITHATYDRFVFKKMRLALGGRLKWIIIGSAPTGKDTMEFMKIALSARIIEGYGQTESTGASFLTHSDDHQSSGCVGGPAINTEFKILDIPEMNYSSKDLDEKGFPTPRGEMCIRGPGVSLGYYKDDEKTKEAFDEEGWLHTGDVVLVQQNGSIKIIDRRKNIFKLSQGEYIAPEKLEGIYKNCSAVSEIFVWGDTLQSYVVAVIVPEMATLKKWASTKGITYVNEDELLNNKEIKLMMLEDLKVSGKSKQFTNLELIRNVFLEKNPFSTKDLLTTTFKMKRNEAQKYYNGHIEEMYKQGIIC